MYKNMTIRTQKKSWVYLVNLALYIQE